MSFLTVRIEKMKMKNEDENGSEGMRLTLIMQIASLSNVLQSMVGTAMINHAHPIAGCIAY